MLGGEGVHGRLKYCEVRLKGVFGSSRSGNSERADFTAPHYTSMLARQQVDAVLDKGMAISAC